MQSRFFSCGPKLQVAPLQIGRIFNKVMRADTTKKSRKTSGNSPTIVNNFNRRQGPINIVTHKNRRVTVLNKVFMKYISDLMATGEVGSKLVNKGVEISHVNVAPDFSAVNVYWFSENDGDYEESVEKILKVSAGHLQHELTKLRVIGLVPPINFVKNKSYSVIKEVEDRLAKVDFGEDYTPTAHIIRSKIPVLETCLSAKLKARISQVDASDCKLNDNEENDENNEKYKLEIPEMRQDVMGFHHTAIMDRVKNSIGKSRMAEQRKELNIPSEPKGCKELTSQEVVEFLSSKEQSKLFSDFLKKRAIEEKRKHRLMPLFQVKLQEEMDWAEKMNDVHDDVEDINIDDSYKDDNDDLNSK